MALSSSMQNIIIVLVFCVCYAHAVCTCEKTPPTGNCVCQSDNSNPAQCKVCVCDHITTYVKGALVCSCRPGYAVSNRDRKKCVDIDECNAQTGNPCQQICTNTVGSYSCSCSPGYTVSSANPNMCDDIDECNEPTGSPCQQICANTIGSYSCSCNPGYTVSSTDPPSCIDIDECSNQNTSPCQQVCTNTMGSYSCSCGVGYTISTTDRAQCVVRDATTCPADFSMFSGLCYKKVTSYDTYFNTKAGCTSINATPVIVRSTDDINFLLSVTRNVDAYSFWVGATDLANEGEFIWEDTRQPITVDFEQLFDKSTNTEDKDCLIANNSGIIVAHSCYARTFGFCAV